MLNVTVSHNIVPACVVDERKLEQRAEHKPLAGPRPHVDGLNDLHTFQNNQPIDH